MSGRGLDQRGMESESEEMWVQFASDLASLQRGFLVGTAERRRGTVERRRGQRERSSLYIAVLQVAAVRRLEAVYETGILGSPVARPPLLRVVTWR